MYGLKSQVQIVSMLLFILNIFGQDEDLESAKHFTSQDDYFEKIKLYINNPPEYDYDSVFPPPTDIIRTPAEFEPSQKLVVYFDYSFYCGVFNEHWVFMIKQAELAKVSLICHVYQMADIDDIKILLINNGVSLSYVNNNIQFLYMDGANKFWTRDYSAKSVYIDSTSTHVFVDWIYPLDAGCDQLPIQVARELNYNLYRACEFWIGNNCYWEYALIGELGNFMTDGFGKAITNNWLIAQNDTLGGLNQINKIFIEYHGIDTAIITDTVPYGSTPHIDMCMKFLDDETILIGRTPDSSLNAIIDSNIVKIQKISSVWGKSYKFIRIDFPPQETVVDTFLYWDVWTNDTIMVIDTFENVFYTYTNSLILNNRVLVPIYNKPQDAAAIQVYKDAMPGYVIEPYDFSKPVLLGGAIHCMAHEISRENPVVPATGIPTNAEIPAGNYNYYERFLSKNSIITDSSVIIEPGGFVIAKTDGTISLKPGFQAKQGCFFKACIVQ